jgi:hypothetical protein
VFAAANCHSAISRGLALLGALCGLALPSRRRRELIGPVPSMAGRPIQLEEAA